LPARSDLSFSAPLPSAQAARDLGLVDRIKWTTFARTVGLSGLLMLTIAMDLGLGPQPIAQSPEVLLYKLETTFFVLTFFALLLTYLVGPQHLTRVAWLSLAIDVALAGALVGVTERTQSVFVFVLPLAVLSAAALLERRGAFVAASVAGVWLGLLALYDGGVVSSTDLGFEPAELTASWLRALGNSRLPEPGEVFVAVGVQVAALYATALLSSKLVVELGRAREQHLSERRELAALRQRYEDVFSSLPDGLMTVSEDGVVRSANPTLARILGRERDHLVGRALVDVLPELETQSQDLGGTQEIARGQEPTGELWRASTDGERQILAVRGELLRGRLSALRGQRETLYVVRDITELRARELEHRNRERLASVGAMAMAVAHEIRNPLASIAGSVQMLREQHDDATMRDALMDIVNRETVQLSNWIGEFLEFARPSEPRFERLDLAQLLREKTEAWRCDPRVVDAAFEVDVRIPDGGDTSLLGDAYGLASVIWNLLVNAQQAALEGDAPRVRITLHAGDTFLELLVEDSGPGVPPEDRAHLFEPFYTTRSGGSGLGLATVARVVNMHHGAIRLEDGVLGGARFHVRLPRDLRRHAVTPI
jgi:two-component system sensor histidine kinase PilS (NtrC family)